MSVNCFKRAVDAVPDDDPTSEEEIMFVGRSHNALRPAYPPKLHKASPNVENASRRSHGQSGTQAVKRDKCQNKRNLGPSAESRSAEALAVTDYVANMLIHDEAAPDAHNLSLLARDLGDSDKWQSESSSSEDIDVSAELFSEEIGTDEALSFSSENSDHRELNLLFRGANGRQTAKDQHAINMTDAEIARLLAQQEKLGIGADELIVFDGMGDENWTDFHSRRQKGRTRAFSSTKQTSKRKASRFINNTRSQDPSDEKNLYLSDQGFDWRHNVQVNKKQRENVDFGLTDSELEETLRASWKKDRLKKKDRKKEREQMRALGLLGRRGKEHASPKTRYPLGMTFEEFQIEIKSFLGGSAASLALPPMHHHTRKAVHELSLKLGLKSRSRGGGNERFTILYKTRKTTSYKESSFAGMQKRFSARPGKYSGKGTDSAKSQRPVGPSNASFRNGEIVGAGAPELGEGNKGRAMLEKMGWHTGTGLGADNNQGIAVPVAQVVKTGKAGLG